MEKQRTWLQALQEYNDKKAVKKEEDIPLTEHDVKLINYQEFGEYKINSYTPKRLFLMLCEDNLLLDVFGVATKKTSNEEEYDDK